jgi:hypothetical protein
VLVVAVDNPGWIAVVDSCEWQWLTTPQLARTSHTENPSDTAPGNACKCWGSSALSAHTVNSCLGIGVTTYRELE